MKTLNPIMAAILAALVGTLSLRPCAFAVVVDPPAKVAVADDQNPINALAQLLRDKPDARAAAGKRVETFLLGVGAGGKSFVSADVDKEALGAVARDWAEKEDAGRLALLYFVIGPGADDLAWAAADPIVSKTFKPGMQWEGRLRAALDKWTASDQIGKTMEKTAAAAFLEDAVEQAVSVFSDPRPKAEIDASIAGNDTTAPQVPTPSRIASSLAASTQHYTFRDLYQEGAVVAKVYGPGDKVARLISAKIYTSREPDGKLVNKIGIFDITDPNAVLGQRFSLGVGEQTFALNDSAPGYRQYTLKIETDGTTGERNIIFMRPGSSAKRGPFGVVNAIGNAIRRYTPRSSALFASVEKLLLKRAEQAQGLGNIVNVGGRDFYVTPQGGAKGALVFLPKDKVDDRSLETARELRPDLYVEVAQLDTEGRAANLAGKRHLGAIGDKEYHLAFNSKTALWQVMDGPGDDKPKPPSPPKPAPPYAISLNASSAPDDAPGAAAAPAAAGESSPTVLELENRLLALGWMRTETDMAEMDADLQAKYRILWRQDARLGLQYSVLVAQAIAPGGQLLYKNIMTPPLVLKRVMGWKHYLIVQFDRQQQYLDLLQPDLKNGFKLVANAETMADGLKRFGASPAADEQHLHAGR